jgi:hypothetical protein
MNVWHELRNTGLLMTTDNETEHERVNPITSGIGTPSGLIFVWHTVSCADHIVYRGYPAQGGTKLRNGLRASCYSRLRGGQLGPLGQHFVARL